jgi:hypothetical protein
MDSMQSSRLAEWKKPATIIAIIALAISGFVGGIEIREYLNPATTTPTTHTTTQTILVSKGTIQLIGPGSVTYINFTTPGSLVSATINATFTGAPTNITRLSILSASQYPAFKNCNCITGGNYTSISTTWSSPMTNQYAAQVDVPGTGKWIIAFQHAPGNGGTESIDETLWLTYTVVS